LTTASGIEVRVEWRWRSERFWFERERRGEERRGEEKRERRGYLAGAARGKVLLPEAPTDH
jgi:hypothetical protein